MGIFIHETQLICRTQVNFISSLYYSAISYITHNYVRFRNHSLIYINAWKSLRFLTAECGPFFSSVFQSAYLHLSARSFSMIHSTIRLLFHSMLAFHFLPYSFLVGFRGAKTLKVTRSLRSRTKFGSTVYFRKNSGAIGSRSLAKAPLSVAAFSEGDAVPQIRPRVCSNSRSTLGLDSRHPALTSFTIPHAGARCIRVLVSPILRLYTYTNAYSHVRALAYTCARVARVIPRCSLRTRDTAEVMREPGRIVLLRLYYATSPSIHRPLFILLSLPPLSLLLASLPSRLFCCHGQIRVGIALYIHGPRYDKYDCVISKGRSVRVESLENYFESLKLSCCKKQNSSCSPKLKTNSRDGKLK